MTTSQEAFEKWWEENKAPTMHVFIAGHANRDDEVAALCAKVEELVSKNQNLFNALMVSTQKKDSMYAAIRSATGHLNLYGLFSCIEGGSYDPECADKNVRKANSILKAELTTEIIKPVGKEDQEVVDSIFKDEYK